MLNGEPHGDGDHAAPAEDDLSEQAFDPRIELAEWLHGELVREYAGETESWATERVARVMARLNAERADAEPKEAVILLLRERRERVVAYLRKQQAENASRGTG